MGTQSTSVRTKTISNWSEFEALAAQLKDCPPSGAMMFYRGQADSSHSLTPSLLRRVPKEVRDLPRPAARRAILATEEFIRKQFMSQAELHAHPIEISERTDKLAWWAVMQHYGAPTRLLDWSLSPYVALYFAVEKNFTKPGAIWSLEFAKLHSAMSKRIPTEIGLMSTKERNDVLARLKSKPYVFLYERTRKASRMVAQQHAFTISTDVLLDYEQALTASAEGPFAVKYVVAPEAKLRFLARLRIMNITSSSLFPGLEGLGRHAGELASLEFASRSLAAVP